MKIQEKLYLNTAWRYFHKSSRREFVERKQKKTKKWKVELLNRIIFVMIHKD